MNKHTEDEQDRSSYMEEFDKSVAIIGGGMGGCMSAWVLANAGWHVTIIESAPDLLSKSADKTPGRMGLGFHYADLATAEKYLRATINFVREFPDFQIGQDKPQSHFLRHGRYFITKDSLHTSEEIMKTYNKLRDIYTALVKEDSQNEVFGDPDVFFRVLYRDEYKDVIEANRVVKGIETCEHLLNWPKFKEFFLEKLKNHENIRIIANTTVTKAKRLHDARFLLSYTQSDTFGETEAHENLVTPYVLNCSWQNSESLDVQIGLKNPEELNRSNRVKVLAKVRLPKNLREIHSSFFLTGPHCMVSNMGDEEGTALMSYAPITNINVFSGLTLPPAWSNLINGKYSPEDIDEIMPDIALSLSGVEVKIPERLTHYLKRTERADWDIKQLLIHYYGERVKEGVSKYIPDIQYAEVVDVRFGIVKTKGETNIADKNSAMHKRDYSGIEELQCGWITNDLMKLLYGLDNANEVLKLLNKHHELDRKILLLARQHSQGDQAAFCAARNVSRRLYGHTESSITTTFTDTDSSRTTSEKSHTDSESDSWNSSPRERDSAANKLHFFHSGTGPKALPVPEKVEEPNKVWSQEYGLYYTKSHSAPTSSPGSPEKKTTVIHNRSTSDPDAPIKQKTPTSRKLF